MFNDFVVAPFVLIPKHRHTCVVNLLYEGKHISFFKLRKVWIQNNKQRVSFLYTHNVIKPYFLPDQVSGNEFASQAHNKLLIKTLKSAATGPRSLQRKQKWKCLALIISISFAWCTLSRAVVIISRVYLHTSRLLLCTLKGYSQNFMKKTFTYM